MIIAGVLREEVLLVLPLILVLLGIFFWVGSRKRSRFFQLFGSEKRKTFSIIHLLFAVFAIVFLILALAGPFLMGPSKKQGLRVLIGVDNSWSMKADDYLCPSLRKAQEGYCWEASRFSHMQDDLGRLFERFPKAEIGLVTFAGDAYLWEPRVTDVDSLLWIIRNWIQPGLVFRQGSELTLALSEALEIAKEHYSDDVVLILLSDGTDLRDITALVPIANEYRSRGVKIVTVGYGQGAKEIRAEEELLQANFNPVPLRWLAEATGGEYRHSKTGNELVEIFMRRSDLQRTLEEKNVHQDLFQIFGAAGFLFFLGLLFFTRR